MSFIEIDDINKRDEIVQKFLALKKNIRARDSAEIQAERGNIEALQKYFKPVTEGIAKITPAQPPPTKEKNIFLNDPELNKYVNMAKNDQLINLDLVGEQPKILLAGFPLNVEGDSIEFMGTRYKRTTKLMDLIFSPDPPPFSSVENTEAYDDFKNMMRDSDALVVKSQVTGNLINNPSINQKNKRWKNLLKHISFDLKTGSGLLDTAGKLFKAYAAKAGRAQNIRGGKHETIIIPSDPLALADRLSLVCGSIKAGNTGLKNEMVELCNALIRKKLMSRKERDELLNTV